MTGHAERRLPGHLSFIVRGAEAQSLLIALDLAGIAASSGSACASGAPTPSGVLRAMGYEPNEALGALRLTLGRATTDADVDTVLDKLPEIVRRVRGALRSAVGERVVCAMSGGVDSSVAAALLKEQGYDVVGIMLRLWSEPVAPVFGGAHEEATNRCCSVESVADAASVADTLGIPFYVINAEAPFKERVVDAWIEQRTRKGSRPTRAWRATVISGLATC